MESIDIVFATNDNFCQHAAVAIASLLENNKNINIHIHLFCIDVTDTNYQRICNTCQLYNTPIKRYNITNDILKSFKDPGNYSLATYLRLFVSSLIPSDISKVLYLDCDLIINGSIKELWDINITNYAAAGVLDCTLSHKIIHNYIGYDYIKDGYVNAGVLLINLDYWRKNNTEQNLITYVIKYKPKLNDQDAINAVLNKKIKFIHPKWNTHSGYFAFPPLVPKEHYKYIKELRKSAKIIHFTGPAKPWFAECVNPYKDLYYRYIKQTAWNGYSPIRTHTWIESHTVIIKRNIKEFISTIISYFY